MISKMVRILLLAISTTFAGGFTNWAVPTMIEVERGGGFGVWGDFGNPAFCHTSNVVYVMASHPQYKEIYATVLSALNNGYQVRFYVHSCDIVAWWSTQNNNNVVGSGGSVRIRR